ncbi:MAG: OmpA family protein, partial [Bacteroidaceae bacterium]|nr:OmpA family protein [Bacteroidaceae bacterium]
EFDSAALLDSSTVALDSLVVLLNENPNVTIELASHCDFRGKDEYNEKLSQRRAESVVNYLIAHGIDTLRLSPKGYGEKRPKIVTRRIAATYDFLNEGDTLTEAFIMALEDEEKQEICHSLNRRTEFKVLRTTYKLFDSPTEKTTSVEKELADSMKTEVDEKALDEKVEGKTGERGAEKIEGKAEASEKNDSEKSEKTSKITRPERVKRPEGKEATAEKQLKTADSKKTEDLKKSDDKVKEDSQKTPDNTEEKEEKEEEKQQL